MLLNSISNDKIRQDSICEDIIIEFERNEDKEKGKDGKEENDVEI